MDGTSESLKGRIALVTGASGALGAAIAGALDERGSSVALHHLSNAEAVASVADRMRHPTAVVGADLADWDATAAMVASVERELGHIGVLVHCAAIREDALLRAHRPEAWARVVQVNLVGTFHVCRAVVAGMTRARFGRILNIISPAALVGSAGQTAYSASKAGVVGLTRSLAVECARRSITVNALSPGFMDTPMTSGLRDEVRAGILDRVPLGRPAAVDEVAGSACRLLEMPYLTGQVVSVDGGLTAS